MSIAASTASKLGNELFEDEEFPPSEEVIGNVTALKDEVAWLRPSEFAPAPSLIKDGVEPGDICQGQLGDCWFLGALSVVASRNDLLRHVVRVDDYKEKGLYQFFFYKFGVWHEMVIDDQIPCSDSGPVFASGTDANELWVTLAEKAYAKLHGSYEALQGGWVTDGLVDLTGGVPSVTYFDKVDPSYISGGGLWQDLLGNYRRGDALMGCALGSNGPNEQDTGSGILQGHAYGILEVREYQGERLIRCRNPWGCTEWTGPWSDQDPRWNDSMLKELNYSLADDGTFWIAYNDFIQQFNKLYVCRLMDKGYHNVRFHSEFKGPTAGGCVNHDTWSENPQYKLTLFEEQEVVISLQQPDPRLTQDKAKYIGFAVFHVDETGGKTTVWAPVDQTEITNLREISLTKTLGPGEYNIIPYTFEAGQETAYHLSVWAKDEFGLISHNGETPQDGSSKPPQRMPQAVPVAPPPSAVTPGPAVTTYHEPDDDGTITAKMREIYKRLKAEAKARYPAIEKAFKKGLGKAMKVGKKAVGSITKGVSNLFKKF